jgi:hypothetical protein
MATNNGKGRRKPRGGIVLRPGQPLIVIPDEEDGEEIERVYTSWEELDADITDEDIQETLNLAGAWSDLDFDEFVSWLERRKQESPPSPPFSL